MIKILIKQEGKKVKLLEVKGHADSAPYGKDLVCAAVSAVLTGGFNAIQDVTSLELILKEGYASLEVKQSLSPHDEVVVETIISGLETIADSHQDFVQVKKL
ncbi:MAG TPA: ribosomal-processing cysteine protease Prp [Bacilli bacterium]|nr:ribosomal-processing cysteine protease Prp [Bacilli bacterium]HPS18692.1 ribosomal-processing cysteine protease Prp [Bacilli bacterium]